MKFRDNIDDPDDVARGPHSPALGAFLWTFFGYGREWIQPGVIGELTPEDLAVARDVVRRNLKLRQYRIIEAAALLNDIPAAPILRTMLEEETNDSQRLTIAGTLWKLERDPVFVEVLNQCKRIPALNFQVAVQALWLDDVRAVDFLIDLLPEEDRECTLRRGQRRDAAIGNPFRRFWLSLTEPGGTGHPGNYALSFLNRLKFGREVERQLQHLPSWYRMHRNDPAFRDYMTAAVQRWNAEWNGRSAVAAV